MVEAAEAERLAWCVNCRSTISCARAGIARDLVTASSPRSIGIIKRQVFEILFPVSRRGVENADIEMTRSSAPRIQGRGGAFHREASGRLHRPVIRERHKPACRGGSSGDRDQRQRGRGVLPAARLRHQDRFRRAAGADGHRHDQGLHRSRHAARRQPRRPDRGDRSRCSTWRTSAACRSCSRPSSTRRPTSRMPASGRSSRTGRARSPPAPKRSRSIRRLDMRPTDILLVKKYASCFFGTDLVPRLNSRRIDTLIITGCTTSGCVRATRGRCSAERLPPDGRARGGRRPLGRRRTNRACSTSTPNTPTSCRSRRRCNISRPSATTGRRPDGQNIG